jgi:hypothetical protein
LQQDRNFHVETLTLAPEDMRGAMAPYVRAVITGAQLARDQTELLEQSGFVWASPEFRAARIRLADINFPRMEATIAGLTADNLRTFISALRKTENHHEMLIVEFWTSPLSLARIVVRELALMFR